MVSENWSTNLRLYIFWFSSPWRFSNLHTSQWYILNWLSWKIRHQHLGTCFLTLKDYPISIELPLYRCQKLLYCIYASYLCSLFCFICLYDYYFALTHIFCFSFLHLSFHSFIISVTNIDYLLWVRHHRNCRHFRQGRFSQHTVWLEVAESAVTLTHKHCKANHMIKMLQVFTLCHIGLSHHFGHYSAGWSFDYSLLLSQFPGYVPERQQMMAPVLGPLPTL